MAPLRVTDAPPNSAARPPRATPATRAGQSTTSGLPTRVDQERSLHKLNQLESRLLDLEEQLVDAHAQLAAARKAAAVGAHAAAVVTDIPSGQVPAE